MLATAAARAAAARDSYHRYWRAPAGCSKRGGSRNASNTHGGGRSATVEHGRHTPDGGRRRRMVGQTGAVNAEWGGGGRRITRVRWVGSRIPAKRKSGSYIRK